MTIAKRWLVGLISVLLLAACAPGSTAPPAGPAAPTITNAFIQATKSSSLPAKLSPSPMSITQQPDSNGPVTNKTGEYFQGPLSVIITSPLDEAVVQTARVVLTGEADPETVISFNDEIVLVGSERKFSVPLALEEGPNIIEITASDSDGNQASGYLTIIYDPQS